MKKIYSILALAAAFCAFLPLANAQGIVSKGTWTEKDGLSYTKYISEPNTDGVYMITLESFTTGSIELTDNWRQRHAYPVAGHEGCSLHLH